MRSTFDQASVRLYHLDEANGAAHTIMYGTLAEALAVAAAQPEDLHADLFLQTDNDVVGYLDLTGG